MSLSGCGEEPAAIEITFTNATDRRISMYVLLPDETLTERLERGGLLLMTHDPGERWRHDAGMYRYPDGWPEDDGPWCENRVYVFVSPKDPTVTSRGVSYENDPIVTIDDVDVIAQLASPCWDDRTGNEHTVESRSGPEASLPINSEASRADTLSHG